MYILLEICIHFTRDFSKFHPSQGCHVPCPGYVTAAYPHLRCIVYNAPALCGYVHTIRSSLFTRETQRITHDSLLTMPYGAKLPNQPQSAVRLHGSLSTNLDSAFCGQVTECLSCYPNAVLSPGTHEESIREAPDTHGPVTCTTTNLVPVKDEYSLFRWFATLG